MNSIGGAVTGASGFGIVSRLNCSCDPLRPGSRLVEQGGSGIHPIPLSLPWPFRPTLKAAVPLPFPAVERYEWGSVRQGQEQWLGRSAQRPAAGHTHSNPFQRCPTHRSLCRSPSPCPFLLRSRLRSRPKSLGLGDMEEQREGRCEVGRESMWQSMPSSLVLQLQGHGQHSPSLWSNLNCPLHPPRPLRCTQRSPLPLKPPSDNPGPDVRVSNLARLPLRVVPGCQVSAALPGSRGGRRAAAEPPAPVRGAGPPVARDLTRQAIVGRCPGSRLLPPSGGRARGRLCGPSLGAAPLGGGWRWFLGPFPGSRSVGKGVWNGARQSSTSQHSSIQAMVAGVHAIQVGGVPTTRYRATATPTNKSPPLASLAGSARSCAAPSACAGPWAGEVLCSPRLFLPQTDVTACRLGGSKGWSSGKGFRPGAWQG